MIFREVAGGKRKKRGGLPSSPVQSVQGKEKKREGFPWVILPPREKRVEKKKEGLRPLSSPLPLPILYLKGKGKK